MDAFLLWPSNSCLRCRKPSNWAEGDSWLLAGRVDDWLPLPRLPEVGDGMGLGSLELRSGTPFTISPSTPSWDKTETQREKSREKFTHCWGGRVWSHTALTWLLLNDKKLLRFYGPHRPQESQLLVLFWLTKPRLMNSQLSSWVRAELNPTPCEWPHPKLCRCLKNLVQNIHNFMWIPATNHELKLFEYLSQDC